MRSEIMQLLRDEYAQQREKNTAEEYRRRDEAEQRIPELAPLLQARQELIFSGVRGILYGMKAENLPEKMADLNSRITGLLVHHGYSKDWLDPVYRCPICRDTGYTGDTVREMCGCMREAYHAEVMRRLGLGDDTGISFEQFDETFIPETMLTDWHITQRQLTARIKQQAQKWTQAWPDAQHMVLMYGESGLGKTYLMRCMARALTERGREVLMVSAYQLMDAARKSIFNGEGDELAACMEVECLLLDDLGSEPMIPNITVEQLYSLINERDRAGKATVISTNLNPEHLRERYGERIVSRMTDRRNALVLVFCGDDLRLLQRRS